MRRSVRALIVVGLFVAAGTALAVHLPDERDETPLRVWLKVADRATPVVVCDRPGGEPMPGTWRGWAACGVGGIDGLFRSDFRSAPSLVDRVSEWLGRPRQVEDAEHYSHTWFTVERDGTKWRMFTRPERFPGEDLSPEECLLVGRWRHRERSNELDLELGADRTGRGSDGSVWAWLAGPGGFELSERRNARSGGAGPEHWYATRLVLESAQTSYHGLHDSTVTGTRLDPSR